MPRCELTGKGPVSAHLVSHSNIKTKTINHPNIQNKKLHSQSLNEFFSMKVATSTIRNIEHSGGFDSYILNADDKKLSKRAQAVKKRVRTKLAGPKKKK